ncbi:putative sister chromatid separation protein (Src1) [Aspergillus fijiensis CBS 313.89]|uniref:Sister chromatid separation protein n=1 Tax=Aspergillus fijiensis CBS 313.89 TaxID=1448319 RepID=A0A8G1RRH7_9EURO|nr:sister chromatid separation protein [Aspergillus fijiensis CBS 313.89]RAK77352.1 sister chromatid separation protein [Aspergillus fijiensis CBS 313.89]
MADGLDYLAPDFDLNSLTVPRLRSILVSHDVPYPASAKKAQLISILETEVLPQAKKLLRERERVRRTSEGITDMGSRASSVVSDYNDQHHESGRESMPPPPTPSTVSTATGGRRARSKLSTRASTVDTEDAHVSATPSTSSRRTVPRSTSKRYRASDTESHDDMTATPVPFNMATPRKSTTRKPRKSEMTPAAEPQPEPEPEPKTPFSAIKLEPKDESVFTDDNPFQSGSPARWEHRSPRTSSVGRKSASRFSLNSPAASNGLRPRRSMTPVDMNADYGFTPSKRSSFEFPVPKPRSPQQSLEAVEKYEDSDSEVSAGEEFTPEEQLALEEDRAHLMYPPSAPSTRPQQARTANRAAPWIIILALVAGFGAWWRKEKIEIGFCGIGKPTWSLADTRVPEWANFLEPQCEPCPPHAFCYPNFEARCEHDFILKAHPLSLGGLVPLAPTCEADSEKARRVKAVADRALETLRDRRAKWECGEIVHGDQGEKGPEISETELKQEVGKKRRKGMSDAEFDDLWKGALGEVVGKEEVVTRVQQPSSVLTLTSTSVSRLPLTCAFRRYVRLSLLAYRLPISVLTLAVCLTLYVRSKIRARRSDMARVPELVATTLDRLATQAALHARGAAREPYIPIGQLRDDVLRSELRGSRREGLWKRVRSIVEGNANVRAAVREGRGGDVARVWEWIGGIGSVRNEIESSGNSTGRDVHKMHFSPSSPEDGGRPLAASQDATPVPRKWDEGRPIY